MTLDQDSCIEFRARFVTDLGATMAAGNVVVGHRLGLYRALATEPGSPAQLAGRTGTDPRYVAVWLAGQAAGGYVTYDASTGTYSMTEEQAFAMADPDGPNLPAAFLIALGALKAEPRITDDFRTGRGMGWHEHDPDVFTGTEAFTRAAYAANLVPSWLPARTAWSTSSRPAGGSPTWAADWVRRPYCSPRPIRNRRSSAPTTTSNRSTWPVNVPPPPVFRTGSPLRWHRHRPSPAPATTS